MNVTQCQSACSDTVTDMNSCTSVSCICTNQNGQQLKRCVDCLVEVADSDTATENGQMTLDGKCLSSVQALADMILMLHA